MTGFYFAFLAVLLAGVGARDQIALAGLAQRQGARPAALAVGIAVSFATAAFAAWAGATVAPLLAPKARLFLTALALALAGAESLLVSPGRMPEEPTASLGALFVVLLAHQLTDAARFLIFAIAIASSAPLPAGLGGAAAGAAMLAAGWLAPELFARPSLRVVRRWVGAGLLLIALGLGLRVFGWL